MMTTAPIVLFVFNRPEHTRRVLNSLKENVLADESLLYIIADGPRQGMSVGDMENINQVRKVIKSENWCREVVIREHETNKGLSGSIIPGVTELVEKHGRVIVLEDDILVSKGFLKYMNSALGLYADEECVGCIHGWNYPIDTKQYSESTFFLKGADCWGWATWKRAWDLFEKDAAKLLESIHSKKLEYDFDRRDTNNFTDMLAMQAEGKIDSWAVRWHASLFLAGKYCLQPTEPIVKNIGLDNSGVHCDDSQTQQEPVDFIELEKISIEEVDWFFDAYRDYSGKLPANSSGSGARVKGVIKSVLPQSVISVLKKLRPGNKEQWEGNYKTWHEAKSHCTGYNDQVILEKCKTALLKVKNGEAIYERDSVLFDKIQYSRGLLALLKKVSSEKNRTLCVLDFGGSLGSTYYQNKKFLDTLSHVEWCIVEQSHFVECGKSHFEKDTQLKFFYTLEECLAKHSPDMLILSGVLQYLEDPGQWIDTLFSVGFQYILIDGTSFVNEGEKDILTIQTVPSGIYEASYPAWFFGKERLRQIQEKYDILYEFKNGFTPPAVINKTDSVDWIGLALKKRHS